MIKSERVDVPLGAGKCLWQFCKAVMAKSPEYERQALQSRGAAVLKKEQDFWRVFLCLIKTVQQVFCYFIARGIFDWTDAQL